MGTTTSALRPRRYAAGLAAGLLLATGSITLAPTPAFADDVRDSQWMIDALQLDKAHQISTGEGITIGIVDTGIDTTHPDLTGTVIAGKDTWSTNHDGQTDPVGHGTAMASLIAGHGHGPDNNDGVLGIAPGAKILSYGAWAEGDTGYDNDELTAGINWVIDNGADIILLAYGGGSSFRYEEEAVARATEQGIPVIAPSGNISQGDLSPHAPATYEDVIMVGGTNSSGEHDKDATPSARIYVSAPSADITAAYLEHGYDTKTGTSNAAAIVAGYYALIMAKYPDITPTDLYYHVQFTADDRGEEGPDSDYGYGVIDPMAALTTEVKSMGTDEPSAPASSTDTESSAPSVAVDQGSSAAIPLWALIVGGVLIVVLVVAVVLWVRDRRRGRGLTGRP